MKITYLGKTQKFSDREAYFSWKENLKEEKLAEKLMNFLDNKMGYKNYSVFDHCLYLPIDDREEFEDLKEEYKEAKKINFNFNIDIKCSL